MAAAYLPLMQSTQVASLVAAVTAEALPVGQDWHVTALACPFAVENLPPAQLLHTVVPDDTVSSHVHPKSPLLASQQLLLLHAVHSAVA